MRLGTKQIGGVETEIHADQYGQYSIQVDGKSIGMSPTLDGAVAKARETISRDKTKVHVEFITKSGGERGVATGFHSRNRRTMAKVAGTNEQLDYGYRAFKPSMPEDKLNRYFKLKEEIEKLKREQREIEDLYDMVLREEVQRAITEATDKTLAGAVAKAAQRRQNKR